MGFLSLDVEVDSFRPIVENFMQEGMEALPVTRLLNERVRVAISINLIRIYKL